MVPNFLSRFVKSPPPSRQRSSTSTSSTQPSSSSASVRQRSPSTPNPALGSVPQPQSQSPSPSLRSEQSSNTTLNVVVVPPSPLPCSLGLDLQFPSDHRQDSHMQKDKPQTLNVAPRIRTISAPSPRPSPTQEYLMSPKLDKEKSSSPSSPSRSQPPSPSNFANLKLRLQKSTSNLSLSPPPDNHRKSSKKPPKQLPPPITVPASSAMSRHINSPPLLSSPVPTGITVSSPVALPSFDELTSKIQSAPLQPIDTNGSMLQAPKRDSDNVSIASSTSQGQNRRQWSSNPRKPSGAAVPGLGMVNPTLSQAHLSDSSRKNNPLPASPSQSSVSQPPTHSKSRSADMTLSPKVKGLALKPPSRRQIATDNASENYIEGPEYLELDADSGLDDGGSGSGSDSELDIGRHYIPVTGFAVASNKRNADFHELFPNIPDGDYLIEDYGCALQREILVQGRLYVSENHVCFHANIFGWITDLSIPVYDITVLEKKMTAFVIPNAIHISTRNCKYTFASFLSRDTTFDVIYNIWRQLRPDDITSIFSSAPASLEGASSEQVGRLDAISKVVNKATLCACGRDGEHYPEVALDIVLPGTPDRIYNLMFASGFIKDFLAVNQKLTDIQISDWTPIESGSKLLARNMSYIKPLNAGLGPKQTKCEIRDEMVYANLEDYLTMLTTTRTPDVPSGSVFSVKTRTCIMWASAITTKVVVTTQVEWTGRSFIKGIIEKSAIEGQKLYHVDLERAIRAYIQEHQSEFVPAGIDPLAIELAESATINSPRDAESSGATEQHRMSIEEERRQREHERNRRGLQWAWDTFDGAYQVAKRSTKGALELVKEAWDQSTTTTILWFVIVTLVFSNLWTLVRMGRREEIGRRKELMRAEERDRWVQGVVGALRDELVVKPHVAGGSISPPRSSSWHREISNLKNALDTIEERTVLLRYSLDEAERTTDSQVSLD